jgi:hypothetical protein
MKTLYNPWDIVLCPMKFSDWVGWKFRPVVILAEDRWDFLVCAISTQLHQSWQFDLLINSDDENKLRSEKSVIRIFKMTTITPELIHKKRWKLSKNDWIHLKDNMQQFVNSR